MSDHLAVTDIAGNSAISHQIQGLMRHPAIFMAVKLDPSLLIHLDDIIMNLIRAHPYLCGPSELAYASRAWR